MKAIERIAQIEARLKAATPGPWQIVGEGQDPPHGWPIVELRHYSIWRAALHGSDLGSERSDVTFIANAPADLEWMLAEVKRYRRVITDSRWREREWKKAAAGWMQGHDALKEKYEPTALGTGGADE